VGKTAVVEGFALRIAAGDVPPAMKNVVLRSLDLGLLQAGAGVKGEFENRLKQVIEEVQSSPTPIILFIDEAHTLIGAGGAAGQGDAANLLKPALARGTLRTIAATTWAEYKKYFEKDPALTRRFQTIKVEEPTEEKTVVMIRGLMPVLEKHHKVDVMDEALEAAAQLTFSKASREAAAAATAFAAASGSVRCCMIRCTNASSEQTKSGATRGISVTCEG
jgi:type VI secretion system protein VasG